MDRPMAGGGLTEDGLGALHEALVAHVERGAVPGFVALVARNGHVWVDVAGTKAFGDPEPLGRTAIFRMASLTKPITAAAAMVLVERGVLRLDDPVEGWLPELADRRVLRSLGSPLDDTVPAARPITLEDLLTSRMGFGCIMAPPDTYPIQSAEEALQLKTLGPPWPPTPHTPDQWLERLGSLPLIHQPGDGWRYNTGLQVLGVLIARASGQPLEAFLRECLFAPLGMLDTAFSFSADRKDRMTTAYSPDPVTGHLDLLDAVDGSYWSSPPAFPDGAGWLLSTIDDYWSFVEMIVGGGVSGGTRILSESSVRLMTTDHLTPGQRADSTMFLGDLGGWGFGMLAPAAGRNGADGPRVIGWDGGTGTTWRSDVDTGLTALLLTQRAMTSPEPPEMFVDFWVGARQALGG